jgi:hypothetical protein
VDHDGRLINCRIRNISTTGAYLDEGNANLKAGDRLSVSFRGFSSIEAIVTRVANKGVGLRFVEPIDPAMCRLQSSSHIDLARFEAFRHVTPKIIPKRPPRPKLFGG